MSLTLISVFLVDTTRVLLGKDGGYINANFIKMPVKDENYMYIACQGPLPTTLSDFWQMVLEQKSNVIAMMTREVEGGKVKCQRYWPDTPMTAEMVDDRLQIMLIKDQFLDNFGIRLIEVKDIQVGSDTDFLLLISRSLMLTDEVTTTSTSSDQRNPTCYSSELHGLAGPRDTHTARAPADLHLLHEAHPSIGAYYHPLQRWDRSLGDPHLYRHGPGPHQ